MSAASRTSPRPGRQPLQPLTARSHPAGVLPHRPAGPRRIKTGKARIIGSGTNRLPLTHAEDAGGAIAHLLTLERTRILGQTVVAVPAATATQLELYTTTARALGRPVPKKAPAPLATLVAGVVIAQTMTLDAPCNPDLLLATGYRFSHPTIATGIPATIAAIARRPESIDRRPS